MRHTGGGQLYQQCSSRMLCGLTESKSSPRERFKETGAGSILDPSRRLMLP